MLKLYKRNVETERTKCWNVELEMLNGDQVASSPASGGAGGGMGVRRAEQAAVRASRGSGAHGPGSSAREQAAARTSRQRRRRRADSGAREQTAATAVGQARGSAWSMQGGGRAARGHVVWGRRGWPATGERREGRKRKIRFGIDLRAVILCTNLKYWKLCWKKTSGK